MAEIIIRLVVDPHTGKKNLIIGYRSDGDAMALEHEDQHRRVVDALLEAGALDAAELGEIIIERETTAGLSGEPETDGASVGERRSVDQDQ